MACGTAYACHWEPSVRATAQAPVHVEYMCAFGAFPHAFWTVGVIEGLHSPSTGNGTGLRYRIWMSFRAVGKSNRASTRAWCVHVCAVHFDPFPRSWLVGQQLVRVGQHQAGVRSGRVGAGGTVNQDTGSRQRHGKPRAALTPNQLRRTRTDHQQTQPVS